MLTVKMCKVAGRQRSDDHRTGKRDQQFCHSDWEIAPEENIADAPLEVVCCGIIPSLDSVGSGTPCQAGDRLDQTRVLHVTEEEEEWIDTPA